jgi:hypothetical protein
MSSAALIKGKYPFAVTAFTPPGLPNGPPRVVAGIKVFDGHGKLTQRDYQATTSRDPTDLKVSGGILDPESRTLLRARREFAQQSGALGRFPSKPGSLRSDGNSAIRLPRRSPPPRS